MTNLFKKTKAGFTLIELMVVISIIGLLSTIVYASFGEARMQARDKTRLAALKELQLSIELYRAQNGFYPAMGCSLTDPQYSGPGPVSGGSGLNECEVYITNLVPDFIAVLPTDPKFESEDDKGFYYRTDGQSYKLMLFDVVETLVVSGYDNEFSRCPARGGACPDGTPPATTYAVYSAGAENW